MDAPRQLVTEVTCNPLKYTVAKPLLIKFCFKNQLIKTSVGEGNLNFKYYYKMDNSFSYLPSTCLVYGKTPMYVIGPNKIADF